MGKESCLKHMEISLRLGGCLETERHLRADCIERNIYDVVMAAAYPFVKLIPKAVFLCQPYSGTSTIPDTRELRSNGLCCAFPLHSVPLWLGKGQREEEREERAGWIKRQNPRETYSKLAS